MGTTVFGNIHIFPSCAWEEIIQVFKGGILSPFFRGIRGPEFPQSCWDHVQVQYLMEAAKIAGLVGG